MLRVLVVDDEDARVAERPRHHGTADRDRFAIASAAGDSGHSSGGRRSIRRVRQPRLKERRSPSRVRRRRRAGRATSSSAPRDRRQPPTPISARPASRSTGQSATQTAADEQQRTGRRRPDCAGRTAPPPAARPARCGDPRPPARTRAKQRTRSAGARATAIAEHEPASIADRAPIAASQISALGERRGAASPENARRRRRRSRGRASAGRARSDRGCRRRGRTRPAATSSAPCTGQNAPASGDRSRTTRTGERHVCGAHAWAAAREPARDGTREDGWSRRHARDRRPQRSADADARPLRHSGGILHQGRYNRPLAGIHHRSQ